MAQFCTSNDWLNSHTNITFRYFYMLVFIDEKKGNEIIQKKLYKIGKFVEKGKVAKRKWKWGIGESGEKSKPKTIV